MKEKKKKKGTPLPDDLFIVYPQNEYLLKWQEPYKAILTIIVCVLGVIIAIVFGWVLNHDEGIALLAVLIVMAISSLGFSQLVLFINQHDLHGNGRRIIGLVIECEGRVQSEKRQRHDSFKGWETYYVENFFLRLVIEYSPKHDHALRTEINVKRNDLRFTALPRNRPVAIYYRSEQDFTVV